MSAISFFKWQQIMRMPEFMEERWWRWRVQQDAYRDKKLPPLAWVQKDRILHPLNNIMKSEAQRLVEERYKEIRTYYKGSGNW